MIEMGFEPQYVNKCVSRKIVVNGTYARKILVEAFLQLVSVAADKPGAFIVNATYVDSSERKESPCPEHFGTQPS